MDPRDTTGRPLVTGLWMVVRKRETDPAEALTGTYDEMLALYEQAAAQWSDTFLVKVVLGPTDVLEWHRRFSDGIEASRDAWYKWAGII